MKLPCYKMWGRWQKPVARKVLQRLLLRKQKPNVLIYGVHDVVFPPVWPGRHRINWERISPCLVQKFLKQCAAFRK